jgi:hypothetical protein
LAAIFKIHSKHLAVIEGNIPENGVCDGCHTKVAAQEFTIFKPDFR